jgi:hypothetical protein
MQTAAHLRRSLERALGAPAPSECRREIAAWLGLRKVFGASTADRTEALASPPAAARMGALRWAVAVASGLLLLFGLAAQGRIEIEAVPLVAKLLAAATGG